MPLTPDILCCSYQLPLQSREHGHSEVTLGNDSLVPLPGALPTVSSLPFPPQRQLPWTVPALTGREDLGDGAATA